MVSCMSSDFTTNVTSSSYNSSELNETKAVSEDRIINILTKYLKKHPFVHFEKLCNVSTDTVTFFEHFNVSEKYKFFKKQSQYFTMGENCYVRLSICSMENLGKYLEKVFISILKKRKKKLNYKSLKYIAMFNDKNLRILLCKISFSDVYEFLKARPALFKFENDRYVSLNIKISKIKNCASSTDASNNISSVVSTKSFHEYGPSADGNVKNENEAAVHFAEPEIALCHSVDTVSTSQTQQIKKRKRMRQRRKRSKNKDIHMGSDVLDNNTNIYSQSLELVSSCEKVEEVIPVASERKTGSQDSINQIGATSFSGFQSAKKSIISSDNSTCSMNSDKLSNCSDSTKMKKSLLLESYSSVVKLPGDAIFVEDDDCNELKEKDIVQQNNSECKDIENKSMKITWDASQSINTAAISPSTTFNSPHSDQEQQPSVVENYLKSDSDDFLSCGVTPKFSPSYSDNSTLSKYSRNILLDNFPHTSSSYDGFKVTNCHSQKVDMDFITLLTTACTKLKFAKHTFSDFLKLQCKKYLENDLMYQNSMQKAQLQLIAKCFDPEMEKKCLVFFYGILQKESEPASLSSLQSLILQAPIEVKTYLMNCYLLDFSLFFYMHLEHFKIDSSECISLCMEQKSGCSSEVNDEKIKLKVLKFFLIVLGEFSSGVSCTKLQKYLSTTPEEVQQYLLVKYDQNLHQFFSNNPGYFMFDEIGRVSLRRNMLKSREILAVCERE